MKIIAIEEHFINTEIAAAVKKSVPAEKQDLLNQAMVAYNPPASQQEDLGAGRLQHMDAMGIDVQVLSYASPGVQGLPAAEAVPLAKAANDQLAASIQAHPDRFAGFATLPTPDPEAAAVELERAVNKLSLKGAMINGRTNDHFLDDPRFRPLLETAVKLEVPLYLHPTVPPKAVQDAYYSGLDAGISTMFATAGWGWHMETGTHALRMILAGVFDRYPGLQLILGHWGEMIPFYLGRIEDALSSVTTKHLQRRISDYFVQQCYVTPSGMFTLPPFMLCMQIMGADRIMYSVDYPFIMKQARTFLENAPLSPADKEKVAHGNAERLLKL